MTRQVRQPVKKPKLLSVKDIEPVEVDELPVAGRGGRRWADILAKVAKKRNQWFMIATFDSNETCYSAQGNLTQRKVIIPYPDHVWSFASRGIDLYAMYEGPVKKGARK